MIFRKVFNGSKRVINEQVNHFRGWKTHRKILVIESDDWGSIRMPNKYVYNEFIARGYDLGKCNYMTYDSIESPEDLNGLFRVLEEFKDKNGNSPIITANTIVANPDFEKIEDNKFHDYHYETFVETFRKYNYSSFDNWLQGMDKKLFKPQFHGREHLNVKRWMKHLQSNSSDFQFAFDNRMFGISKNVAKTNIPSVMAALDADSIEDFGYLSDILDDGLSLFERILGFNSESFIAPNYILPKQLEVGLGCRGIKFLQGGSIVKEPRGQTRSVYLGKTNENSQTYLVRNCVFEPSVNHDLDWANRCFLQVKKAFLANRPAIICSHRVNYIGSISEKNSQQSLRQLKYLLSKIVDTWPSIEFMSSDELGDLINKNG